MAQAPDITVRVDKDVDVVVETIQLNSGPWVRVEFGGVTVAFVTYEDSDPEIIAAAGALEDAFRRVRQEAQFRLAQGWAEVITTSDAPKAVAS